MHLSMSTKHTGKRARWASPQKLDVAPSHKPVTDAANDYKIHLS